MTPVSGLVAPMQEPWQFHALLKDKLQRLACHLEQYSERVINRRYMVSVLHSKQELYLAASRPETFYAN